MDSGSLGTDWALAPDSATRELRFQPTWVTRQVTCVTRQVTCVTQQAGAAELQCARL